MAAGAGLAIFNRRVTDVGVSLNSLSRKLTYPQVSSLPAHQKARVRARTSWCLNLDGIGTWGLMIDFEDKGKDKGKEKGEGKGKDGKEAKEGKGKEGKGKDGKSKSKGKDGKGKSKDLAGDVQGHCVLS